MNRKNGIKIALIAGIAALFATGIAVNAAVTSAAPGGQKADTTTSATKSAGTGATASNPAARIFTVAELAKYNGIAGQPAYIAFKGVVYDLSAVIEWKGGKHHGVSAGTDLTKSFAFSPHSASILSKGKVVGAMQGSEAAKAIEAAAASVSPSATATPSASASASPKASPKASPSPSVRPSSSTTTGVPSRSPAASPSPSATAPATQAAVGVAVREDRHGDDRNDDRDDDRDGDDRDGDRDDSGHDTGGSALTGDRMHDGMDGSWEDDHGGDRAGLDD